MTKIHIKSDPFDAEFRRLVADSIRNSQVSIRIVTGEIAAYNYYDLRTAAEEAVGRGVKVDVYATGPERDIVNRLIHNKINVYIGTEDPREHFMICDDKFVVISEKDENRVKPTKMGNRRGTILDDPGDVRKYGARFKELKSKATKEQVSGEDSLVRALKDPISCG